MGREDPRRFARLDEQRLVSFQGGQLPDDGGVRLPIARGLSGPSVHDQLARVLGHLLIQVVHQHPEGGFLGPAFASQGRAAWSSDGKGHLRFARVLTLLMKASIAASTSPGVMARSWVSPSSTRKVSWSFSCRTTTVLSAVTSIIMNHSLSPFLMETSLPSPLFLISTSKSPLAGPDSVGGGGGSAAWVTIGRPTSTAAVRTGARLTRIPPGRRREREGMTHSSVRVGRGDGLRSRGRWPRSREPARYPAPACGPAPVGELAGGSAAGSGGCRPPLATDGESPHPGRRRAARSPEYARHWTGSA